MRKSCTNCKIEKGLKSFYNKKNGKFGKHAECISCLKKREQIYRTKNPEKKRIRDQIYSEKIRIKFETLKDKESGFHHVRMNERSIMGFERYAEKKMHHLAANLLNYAIRINLIKRPEKCSMCNIEGIIEAHHNDYSKPLQVAWVCRECHTKFHSRKE